MAAVLGDADMAGVTKATLFGAASSGCSFGGSPSGRALQKGAHVVNFLAFMFASTNLIVELGLMILILLGWAEFLVAELLGGLILIAVMAVIVQLTLPETLFEEVRTELNQRDHDHGVTEDPTCGMEGRDEYRSSRMVARR